MTFVSTQRETDSYVPTPTMQEVGMDFFWKSDCIFPWEYHTWFSRLKRLAVFYKGLDFSPTFSEEREKIQHFGFYPEETYSQSSLNTSWGRTVG